MSWLRSVTHKPARKDALPHRHVGASAKKTRGERLPKRTRDASHGDQNRASSLAGTAMLPPLSVPRTISGTDALVCGAQGRVVSLHSLSGSIGEPHEAARVYEGLRPAPEREVALWPAHLALEPVVEDDELGPTRPTHPAVLSTLCPELERF